MQMRDALPLLKDTFSEFNEDKVPRLAAALSYATIFSIAPLFIITISVVAFFLNPAAGGAGHHGQTEDALVNTIRGAMGDDAAKTVRGMVTAAFNRPRSGRIAAILGWITLIIGASGLFAALQDSLNTVWHVEAKKQSIWATVRERVASLGMVLAIGFVLLVSFAVNAVAQFATTYLQKLMPFPQFGVIVLAVSTVVSLLLITLLLALIFRVLPDVKIAWKDVGLGAFATALLFLVGQWAIGLYIGKTGVASSYGAAGSLIVILLWVYYSSMIILLGAEFTKVYARLHGSGAGNDDTPADEQTTTAVVHGQTQQQTTPAPAAPAA
jgi:membrane protein